MVAMSVIAELSRRIAEEFNPDKIILFGSHAYGAPREYSDVDLLVIMPFEGHPFDKSMEILNTLDPDFSVDVIVRDPADAARRYREYDPLIREAFDRGRVLHARPGWARRQGSHSGPHRAKELGRDPMNEQTSDFILQLARISHRGDR